MAKRPAPRATRAAARIAKAGERLNTRIEKRLSTVTTKKAPKLEAKSARLKARVEKRTAAGKPAARATRRLERTDARIARVDARRQALLGLLGRGTTSPVGPVDPGAAGRGLPPAGVSKSGGGVPFDPGAAGRGLPPAGVSKSARAAMLDAIARAPAPPPSRTGPLAGTGFNPNLPKRYHGATRGPLPMPPAPPLSEGLRLPVGKLGGNFTPSTQSGLVSRPTTPDELSRPFTDPVRR